MAEHYPDIPRAMLGVAIILYGMGSQALGTLAAQSNSQYLAAGLGKDRGTGTDSGRRWRRKDLVQWIFEEFRISMDETTVGRELKALGFALPRSSLDM